MVKYDINNQYLLVDNNIEMSCQVYVTDVCSEYLFLNNLKKDDINFPSYDYVLELQDGNIMNENITLVKLDVN